MTVAGTTRGEAVDHGDDRADRDADEAWGSLPADEVAARLDVDPERGLDDEEVGRRRDEHGPNRVQRIDRDPPWKLFVDQFRSPLILLLLGAAGVAGAVGELRDSLVIVAVLTLNAVLGFVQEYRAQRSMAALRSMLRFTARVRRAGEEQEVDGAELVPGDVVLVESGDRVPADGRVVETTGLAADESTLTGESTTVDKQVEPTDPDVPLAERAAEVFMGTTVTTGSGVVVVTGTGEGSEMGRLSARMREQEDRRSPLEQRLSALATRLSVVALVAAATVVGVGMLRGDSFGDALIDGVVLAVASIPEGLPVIVTVTLALGMRAMAREGAVIEDLRAIHTLGATTAICTDKTGTLTENRMTAQVLVAHGRRHELGGDDGTDDELPEPAVRVAVLCNDAERGDDGETSGDPTEVALLELADHVGLDRGDLADEWPRVADVPFSSDRKLMATFHRADDGVEVLVKGAPAVVLERCTRVAGDDGDDDLDDAGRDEQRGLIEELTGDGLRVLALARTRRDDAPAADADVEEREAAIGELVLEGLVGLEDPPRPEAAGAVEECRRAGVAVKMVTGDNARTAAAIARRVGIEGEAVEGRELDELDDDALADRLVDVGVLARVDPEHKVRVVDALAARGAIVAMTGDGVNDAAALDRAHVGVAMGQRGTEVAKEAGDVVLTDDQLPTIVAAVRRGRTIYDNIITFVRFNLATNLGALLTILVARAIGLPTPFTPLQVLWVNLIMDGPPAMALGADPPAPDVMSRPPRDPEARILEPRRLAGIAGLGAWMAAMTLLVFWYGREAEGDDLAITLAFTTFVLFQAVNAVNVRTGWQTVFSRRTLTNRALWGALAGVVTLQVLVVQVPGLRSLFATEPLSPGQWALAVGAALTLLPVSEAARWVVRRYRPTDTA